MADDNSANELGHTNYPKYIDHPTEKVGAYPKRVVVKDADEEAELVGSVETKKKPSGWPK